MTAPQPPRKAGPTLVKPTLADITSKGGGLPNRYAVYAVRGWGKTSFSAQTPKPVFIPTEDGVDTLIDAGQIKETPHFPIADSWPMLNGYIDALINDDHDYKTAVLDVLDGCESLLHQHVCHRDFGGDWGPKGFANYGKGFAASIPDWKGFLAKLDRLRSQRKMTILALAHTKIKEFKNPTDLNYDRYIPNLHETTWNITGDWADAVLFGNYSVTVSSEKGDSKGKGLGGQVRLLYTENHAAYDAKNRLGLTGEIEMGNSPQEGWSNFISALKRGKEPKQ